MKTSLPAVCAYTWYEHDKIWQDQTIPAYANPTRKYGGIWRFLTLQNFFLHLVVNSLLLIGELITPGKKNYNRKIYLLGFLSLNFKITLPLKFKIVNLKKYFLSFKKYFFKQKLWAIYFTMALVLAPLG